jgi:hypothetical protein
VGASDRIRVAFNRLRPWLSATVKRATQVVDGDAPPRDRAETDLLLALAFFAAIGPFFLPKTPIFGGTKHWMPAYPFLAMFAGRGFVIIADAMERALEQWKLDDTKRLAARVGLVVSVIIAPLAITAHSHPFGLTSYVPLVGGAPGGADLGLNRQFWGYTTQNANDWMGPNAPRNASVFIHDTAYDSWARMLDEKRVRPDLHAAGSPSEAQIALVQHELHMSEVDFQIWMAFGTDAPVYVVTHDGVPVVSIYERPK